MCGCVNGWICVWVDVCIDDCVDMWMCVLMDEWKCG